MSTITFAEIVASVRAAKTAVSANENTFIGELRSHDSSKTNQQNIAYFLNVMSVMDLAGLGDIVKMLTNHTNLMIVDGAKPETKVNSHGNLYKSRKDEGYETATTYKIAFKAKLEAENTGLTVGPWDALYALHSGYKTAPKAMDKLTAEENQARVDEWQRRADFMTAFLAGQALTVKLANGEEGDDDYEPAMVIEPEQYNGSLIELAAAIKKAERKAKANKAEAELTPAEKAAKKVANKKAAIKKLMDELAKLDGGKEAVAELVDEYDDRSPEEIEAAMATQWKVKLIDSLEERALALTADYREIMAAAGLYLTEVKGGELVAIDEAVSNDFYGHAAASLAAAE